MNGLRKWSWGELPVYNGFSHEERVRGWQCTMFLIDNGWAERGATCCISGQTQQLRLHSENYFFWEPYTINHSIHMALHQRFRKPDAWGRIVDQYARTGSEWFARVLMTPVDLAGELRAKHGPDIADIFARVPVPEGVAIPYNQIYRQPSAAE